MQQRTFKASKNFTIYKLFSVTSSFDFNINYLFIFIIVNYYFNDLLCYTILLLPHIIDLVQFQYGFKKL